MTDYSAIAPASNLNTHHNYSPVTMANKSPDAGFPRVSLNCDMGEVSSGLMSWRDGRARKHSLSGEPMSGRALNCSVSEVTGC